MFWEAPGCQCSPLSPRSCSSITHSQLPTSSHSTAFEAFLSLLTRPHSSILLSLQLLITLRFWNAGMVPWNSASNSSSIPFMSFGLQSPVSWAPLHRRSQGSSKTPTDHSPRTLRRAELGLQLGSPSNHDMPFPAAALQGASVPTPTLLFLKASLVISSCPSLGLHLFTSYAAQQFISYSTHTTGEPSSSPGATTLLPLQIHHL